MNNTKKTISCLLAVASITSVTANVDNITKANNDVKVTTEPTQETGKVSAVVLETEQGAVIRVTAHTDVQKVKTTYTVDGTQAKNVNFGNLTKGQVKDIQINFGTQKPAVKSVKTLPNTAVVSERVEFAKTVKSHAIKGSVSFEYETTEVTPAEPVAPTVPTKPADSVKPIKPVDTTKPVTPTKPVDTVKPTEPTKPVDVTKPAEPVKPVDTTKPVTPTKPAEPVKPVDTTKPTEPAKPVEKPTTPVDTKPKDEPTTPSTPKEDNGTWKEETRTRTVTVDEEYTENTTEDVFEEKQLFDDWAYLIADGVRHELGWVDEGAYAKFEEFSINSNAKDIKEYMERKVRETKKVKVGTKVVPVTKVRKVQKQETYTVWVNSKTGEVRTSKPTVPTTPKEDKGTWKEETRTRTVTVDEEYTENTTEDVFEEKQLFDQWLDIVDQNGKLLKAVGWSDDYTDDQISDMVLALTDRNTQAQSHEYRKVRETKKVKVGTKTVPVTKVRKVQKQETYTVWVNSKTGEVRTERP